jgi:hypothetical protein
LARAPLQWQTGEVAYGAAISRRRASASWCVASSPFDPNSVANSPKPVPGIVVACRAGETVPQLAWGGVSQARGGQGLVACRMCAKHPPRVGNSLPWQQPDRFGRMRLAALVARRGGRQRAGGTVARWPCYSSGAAQLLARHCVERPGVTWPTTQRWPCYSRPAHKNNPRTVPDSGLDVSRRAGLVSGSRELPCRIHSIQWGPRHCLAALLSRAVGPGHGGRPSSGTNPQPRPGCGEAGLGGG